MIGVNLAIFDEQSRIANFAQNKRFWAIVIYVTYTTMKTTDYSRLPVRTGKSEAPIVGWFNNPWWNIMM